MYTYTYMYVYIYSPPGSKGQEPVAFLGLKLWTYVIYIQMYIYTAL